MLQPIKGACKREVWMAEARNMMVKIAIIFNEQFHHTEYKSHLAWVQLVRLREPNYFESVMTFESLLIYRWQTLKHQEWHASHCHMHEDYRSHLSCMTGKCWWMRELLLSHYCKSIPDAFFSGWTDKDNSLPSTIYIARFPKPAANKDLNNACRAQCDFKCRYCDRYTNIDHFEHIQMIC